MKSIGKILVSVTALLSLTLTTSVASETKSFNGYIGEMDGYQVSISSIIGHDAYLESNSNFQEAYICESPVTVETLVDGLFMFGAKQMVRAAGDFYYLSKEFPVFGNVKGYGPEDAPMPWSNDLEFGSYDFMKDCKITLTKPGLYHIYGYFEAISGGVDICINIVGDVAPTSSKVYVDGKEMQFEAYNIGDNNYFKLRDIAKAINGSKKQFEVSWDGEKQAINLLQNAPYTEVGGEMTLGDGTVKRAQASTAEVYRDGQGCAFPAYTIDSNNYFELRSLGEIFNFSVSWDGATNSILIETDKDYIKE